MQTVGYCGKLKEGNVNLLKVCLRPAGKNEG